MGQYNEAQGGRMYLVETVEDARALSVRNPAELAYVTQTTLSVNDTARIVAVLRERFPAIQGPRKDDICYATQNRQDAVKELSSHCELMLVVGSRSSSNSNRLRELAEKQGTPAYLIDGPEDIDPAWLVDKTAIGVTAGASAPEVLARQVIARLRDLGATAVSESAGRAENVIFALPKELR